MTKYRIYIDCEYDDRDFAIRLKNRFKSLSENCVIGTSAEKVSNKSWVDDTIKAINKADIVISLITGDYLSHTTKDIENCIVNIAQSKHRFIFPILYRSTKKWSEFSWIVKSNLLPQDNSFFTEISENKKDQCLSILEENIREVVTCLNNKHYKSHDNLVDIPRTEYVKYFISYAKSDSDFAELLQIRLKDKNIFSWRDRDMLKIGQDWREEIDEAIDNSLALIVVMSPEAKKSEYVTYEWAYAWGKGKKIFPMILKQTQLHPRLESLQYLDFTNINTRPWDQLIESLIEMQENKLS